MLERPTPWRQGELERLGFWIRHAPDSAWLIALYDEATTPLDLSELLPPVLSGLSLYTFDFTVKPVDLRAWLVLLPGSEHRAVLSCVGLGRGGPAAWERLERFRSLLVPAQPHVLVVWLTPAERQSLWQQRPAFWSRSSGYFDFLTTGPANQPDLRPWQPIHFSDQADWAAQVRQTQKWLEFNRATNHLPAAVLTDLYQRLVRLYFAVGEYRQGEIVARAHLTVAEQLAYRPGLASALNDLGLARWQQSDRDAALIYYEQALPLWRALRMPAAEAGTLGNLGNLYLSQGDRLQAEPLFHQALYLLRQVGDHAGESTILNHLGLLYEAHGAQVQAQNYFEQALPLRREMGDRAGEAFTMGNIGRLYLAQGHHQQAHDIFRQALAIQQEIDNRPGQASLLAHMGSLARTQGQLSQALAYYHRALHLWQEVNSRQEQAVTLTNIGHLFSACLQEQEMRGAIKGFQSTVLTRSADKPRRGAVQASSSPGETPGLPYGQQALTYYRQALALWQELGDETAAATLLEAIGQVHLALAEFDQALNHLEQALKTYRELGRQDGEARVLENLAGCYHLQQAHEAALALYEQAAALWQELNEPGRENHVLRMMMLSLATHGQFEKLVSVKERHINLNQRLGLPNESDRRILAMFKQAAHHGRH